MPSIGLINPKVQFFSATGQPLAGGTLTTYQAASTTPAATWQDGARTILNTNPIVLDANGQALICLDPAKSYKVVLKTAAGVVLWTVDGVSGGVVGNLPPVYGPAPTPAPTPAPAPGAPAPAPTPAPPPAPITLQAENAVRAGSLTVGTTTPGFNGSGYVEDFGTAGDALTFAVPNVAAGVYDLRIRYFAYGPQQNYITINNAAPIDYGFPGTAGGFSNIVLTGVVLDAGTNSVKISKNWGYIYVDEIALTYVRAPAAAPLPPAAAPADAAYPFASYLVPYATGVTLPSDTRASMEAFIKTVYTGWLARLKSTPTQFGSIPAGGYWVQKSATDLTVSEAMGYGMLITCVMAGYDKSARTKFDGLLKTVLAFPCADYGGVLNMTKLMSYRIAPDGTDGGGKWPALDGDLDIAMALLMAHSQWGSDGAYNYMSIALGMIAQIKAYAFNAAGVIVTTAGATTHSRTSDYMFGHFRAFKAFTGDTFWDDAIAQQKRIINYVQTIYSPTTGLLPDWVGAVDTTTPKLTTSVNDGGNPHEDGYWYNACRDPWRLGSDYVLTGDADLKVYLNKMNAFFKTQSGGVVTALINGYALDGTGLVANNQYWIAAEFYNSMLVGALCDSAHATWINALWAYAKAHPETGYYGTEIQLLCALVASGNWWTPLPGPGKIGSSFVIGISALA